MTKTEFRALSADEMRDLLQALFEDPDGEIAGMTKKQMVSFATTNWEHLEDLDLNDFILSVEEEAPPTEPDEEEAPKPNTDLYVGHRHDHSTHREIQNTDLG